MQDQPAKRKRKHSEAYVQELKTLRESPDREDLLLTIGEAAAHLQTSEDFLYRNWKKLPFAVKLSTRQLRFSRMGIVEYIKEQRHARTRL